MRHITVLLLVCLFLLSSFGESRAWDRTDTAYQAAFVSLALVDWGQTRWMAGQEWTWDGQLHYELNPLMSRHPSKREVDFLVPLGIVTHTAIAVLLPNKWRVFDYELNPRRIWQVLFIGIETCAVGNNVLAGTRVEF
jgi:hypothetical protein